MTYHEEPTLDVAVDTPRAEALAADLAWGVQKETLPPAPPPLSMMMPIALDGFAAGVDPLDALVVVALTDGAIHGAWIRGDAGLSVDDVAIGMREAYAASARASRKLAGFGAGERAPAVTLETAERTVLLERIRAYVVVCVFDASIPLGMARLCARQICAQLGPELPLADIARITLSPPAAAPTRSAAARETTPIQLPRASSADVERATRLIAYAEAHLPDAHTVRLRLALRAHTSRMSLDHPEALPSDAMLRIETAVLEMLGMDREQLGALLGDGAGGAR